MSALLGFPIEPDALDLTEISFAEWLPDLPNLNNPGGLEALNVIPADGGYRPLPQHVPETGAALVDPVRGATAVISAKDIVQLYAGTVNGVFTRFGGGAFQTLWTGSSHEEYAWKFIRVNEQMVLLHREHTPMRTPVGTLTAPVVVGGSPPTAGAGAQVGDFLMLGNLLSDPDDGGNPFPSRVRWSGLNNIDAPWISDPATQADFQDMPAEGGPVIAIAGREFGTIFQARSISRATYRGLPNVFDIAVVEDKRGCIARDCVVDVGPYSFFIAEDGFFIWNGTNSTPIGDNKVNRYFFDRLQWSRRHRIAGAADYANGIVAWAFPTDSSGLLNEVIIYSYRDNRWSHSIHLLEYLFTSAGSNVTLDELTDPLESYDDSFDSPVYKQGGRQVLGAFNQYHTYGLYKGNPMAAVMDTGEYNGPSGRRVFINNARPIIDLSSPVATMQLLTRDQAIGQDIVIGPEVAQELDGMCPIMGDGRYVRVRVNTPINSQWQHATGVEINRKATGVF